MTTLYHSIICSRWIFILVATLEIINGCVNGLRTLDENDFEPKPKGTVKTIEVMEDGYLIDCVDIYKLHSLDNQPIQDLQMEPSLPYQRVFNKTNNPLFEKRDNRLPIQNWHRYGQCPKGTIPIRRNWNNNGTVFQKKFDDPSTREYARADQMNGPFHGAGASFNLWNPRVGGAKEFSLAQLWITSGDGPYLQTIEAGWQVYPRKYRSRSTVMFIFWTADGYRHGCYNNECRGNGFQPTHETFCVGCPVANVSEYEGTTYDLQITVNKDRITGHWWLYIGIEKIGYFPRRLFTSLGNGAQRVDFGGEIINDKYRGRHTSTQMGSGHFSGEGYSRASYIKNIINVNQRGEVMHAILNPTVTKIGCYDLLPGAGETSFGTYFYYGGPGYSSQRCPV